MGDFDNEVQIPEQMDFDTMGIRNIKNEYIRYEENTGSNMSKIDRNDLKRAGFLDQRMSSVNSMFDLYVMGTRGIPFSDIPKFEKGELPGYDKESLVREFETFVKGHPVHEMVDGKKVTYPENAEAWGVIYASANNALKDYKLPDVDFGNPSSYGDKLPELAMLSQIGTDLVQVMEQQMMGYSDPGLNRKFTEGMGGVKAQNEFLANLDTLQDVRSILQGCTTKYRDETPEQINNAIIGSLYTREFAHKNKDLYAGKSLHEVRQNIPERSTYSTIEVLLPNAMKTLSSMSAEEQKAVRAYMSNGTPLPEDMQKTIADDLDMLKNVFFPSMQGDETVHLMNRRNMQPKVEKLGETLAPKGRTAPSVSDMTPQQREAALDTFYDTVFQAYGGMYTKSNLDAVGLDQFDMIEVNGGHFKEHCEEAYNSGKPMYGDGKKWADLTGKQREEYMQIELMRACVDPAYNVVFHEIVLNPDKTPSFGKKTGTLGKHDPNAQAKMEAEKARAAEKRQRAEQKDYDKRKKKGQLTTAEKDRELRREFHGEAWFDAKRMIGVDEANKEFGDFCKTETARKCQLRDAGVGPHSVFQVWLMGEKGKSLDEVINMYSRENLKDPIKQGEKNVLVEEFKRFVEDHPTEAGPDPETGKPRPNQENLKIWGAVYKKGIDKIKEHKLPDISIADDRAFEKHANAFAIYFNLGINITQEAERMYHAGSRQGYTGPFMEGMGGSKAFAEMSNIAASMQMIGNAVQNCYSAKTTSNRVTILMDQTNSRSIFEEEKDLYKGKTLGQISENLDKVFELMNFTINDELEDLEVGPKDIKAREKMLEDFICERKGPNELTEHIKKLGLESGKELKINEIHTADSRISDGEKSVAEERFKLFAGENGSFKNVEEMKQEEIDKAFDLYQSSFGVFMDSSTFNVMCQNEKKDYDDLILIDGKPAKEQFAEKYKDLSPLEQEKRVKAEIVKASVMPDKKIEVYTVVIGDDGKIRSGELRALKPYIAPEIKKEEAKEEPAKEEPAKEEPAKEEPAKEEPENEGPEIDENRTRRSATFTAGSRKTEIEEPEDGIIGKSRTQEESVRMTTDKWIENWQSKLSNDPAQRTSAKASLFAHIMAARMAGGAVRKDASSLNKPITIEEIDAKADILLGNSQFMDFMGKMKEPDVLSMAQKMAVKGHGGGLEDMFKSYLCTRPAGELSNDPELSRFMPDVKNRIEALQKHAQIKMKKGKAPVKEAAEVMMLRDMVGAERGDKSALEQPIPTDKDLVTGVAEIAADADFQKTIAKNAVASKLVKGHGGKMIEEGKEMTKNMANVRNKAAETRKQQKKAAEAGPRR